MAEIIARFADGRLLVQESKLAESRYVGSGVPVRIGHLRVVEKVLSLTTSYERYGLAAPLEEVRIDSPAYDTLKVVMRRGDLPIVSGAWISGSAAGFLMSGITSGLAWLGELVSGLVAISGVVKVTANVIGY